MGERVGDMADWILDQPPDPDGERFPCGRCRGVGKIGRRKCPACEGTGERASKRATGRKGESR